MKPTVAALKAEAERRFNWMPGGDKWEQPLERPRMSDEEYQAGAVYLLCVIAESLQELAHGLGVQS